MHYTCSAVVLITKENSEKLPLLSNLVAGKIDVLTLSPNAQMPDSGIDRFVEMGLKYNPSMRIVIQQSWPAYDLKGNRLKNEARGNLDLEELRQYALKQQEIHLCQIRQLNDKFGRSAVLHAPSVFAVLKLREMVRKLNAPMLKNESELFRDPIGHPTKPIQILNSYIIGSCIYNKNFIGSQAFKQAENPEWNALDELLQRIAWETLNEHPLTGLSGTLDVGVKDSK